MQMSAFRGSFDLLAASLLACAGVAVTFAPLDGSAPVRILVALPLVLLLPGYTLLSALTPRFERFSADGLTFTLGLSISSTILTGLLLNFMPWGLQRRPVAIALAVVTLSAALAAAVQRRRLDLQPVARDRLRPTSGQLILLVLALLVASAAVGVARLGAIRADQKTTLTQLWMLPRNAATSGAGATLELGVRNQEGTSETYRLVVRAASYRLAAWPKVVLGSNRQWTTLLRLPPALPSSTRVEADLYRANRPGVIYRHVSFHVPAATTGS